MTKHNKLEFIFTTDSFVVDQPQIVLSHEQEKWKQAFLKNRYYALYQFGLHNTEDSISFSAYYLREIVQTFFREITNSPDLELLRDKAKLKLSKNAMNDLLSKVPFVVGNEYVDKKWIANIIKELLKIFRTEIKAYKGSVNLYITEKSQNLRVPERVFFHLVENKEGEYPFAFLATYATEESKGKVKHVPLAYALTEFKNDRSKLLQLLGCLNKVADVSNLIGGFIESGELFHSLGLDEQEAYQFLKDIPAIEQAGVLCRVPDWWKQKNASVSMNVVLGEKEPTLLGADSLLSLQPKLMVDGVELTRQEVEQLLKESEGLALLKGKWVEVNHEKLQKLLDQIDEVDRDDVSLFEALRMGLHGTDDTEDPDGNVYISNGMWMNKFLHKLRTPSIIKGAKEPSSFLATLRPYQKNGFHWLDYMHQLGLGACIADDMGLGKTVQVLAYLERLRTTKTDAKVLLVVPASLLGNWEKEINKFAPEMDYYILHGKSAKLLELDFKEQSSFLVMTTYGMASRIESIKDEVWDTLVLDEAQAIKNPSTKQTRAIKKLQGRMRIIMTGTPIENNLTNLWSLFDFLNKGLLGTSTEFGDFCKELAKEASGYARLKSIVSPFMLRRLKSDKKIISDLPDKIEMIDHINLSKKQVVLYRKLVDDLGRTLHEVEGINRRGVVLAYLTKFKQLCNHPDQYLGQEIYTPNESGKFEYLRELCETIYEKRERLLIFTQFTEVIPQLQDFLTGIFKQEGLVLHGKTSIKKRQEIVDTFQGEAYVPYVILSLKAGGTGLNLTKASHVIHFDRWWNPAVENQATDRAYRIGQKQNVMVHKFVCRGTIEEKIDALINSKKELAENVIGSGGENWITEMSNQELMDMLKLDTGAGYE
ncbi:non-specific serine/threonine protein kinase [Breznakia blatticola]|uniref:Non-specific serine/threonine protein kinase n=1 Tax=Breznakia blatticola TaxID=1754012 RepID=A0A4R7ZMT0_9FIRM|nr:DEAD/DEAH box helicase [Breznakia blatticola]TDW16530.1 non-specific serine/threonine protein kinase [Breznakia blatticola]